MLFFAFGIAFEVPVATILLVMTGVTSPDKLASMRPYIIVGAFVIGMLLTPPDIISQILLAVPMWVLFEMGLFFSRRIKPRDYDQEASDTDGSTATAAAVGENSSMAQSVDEALIDEPRYRPMTDAEMEAELDDIEDGDYDEALDSEDDDDPKEPPFDKPEG